ncbi:cysteine desulfurase [Roseiconus nitratireducens]|uniref:cysteine desulfurase n=1 Tax=Roseiconus nitratireducens TaxID=2605748 RepID=A0A5M6DIQ8_9BACT|nr:cysteine desulfurase [Roseiconus nitratireducens]KAA5546266.1 cysteine desulfurase [Roseiconus nitratireducens]
MAIDSDTVREAFPVLKRRVNGRSVVYLDSAATYLKPKPVIDAVLGCYQELACTVGRGVHQMAEESSQRYEEARTTIASFVNADPDEVIFVKNATEALNLVAKSLARDAVVLGSIGEHHSNLLPWSENASFHPVGLQDDGTIDLSAFEAALLRRRPALVAVSSIGNAFGVIHPIEQIIGLAHAAGSEVLLDVNQSIAHAPLDVRAMDCDYLCFSGHKLGGPTGVGVLYAKGDRLSRLRPSLLGGGVVESVGMNGHVLADVPMRLEAGTPAFEAVIGLAAACDYFDELGMEAVNYWEGKLLGEMIELLSSVPRVAIMGPEGLAQRGAIVPFHVDGLEAHAVARMLSNRAGICVRSGFHCAQPAHESLSWRPTVRASLGVYNTSAELEALADALRLITANLR